MKKHHLLSSLLLVALLASCNMQGHKLYADGDDDEQSQAPDAQTLETSWSHMQQLVLMAGGTDEQAIRFDREYKTKKDEDTSESFSAAYAAMRVQGKSAEEAIIFANEQAHAPRETFYYAALAMYGEVVALRLSNAYEAQRRGGKSEAWAQAYAKKLVLEGKSDQEAQTYAEELETSFTMMERFSTVAQPGDMKEQGLTAHLYRIALRGNQPLTVAKAYSEHFEQQRQLGKSEYWAHAYANTRVSGKDDTYATTYAAHSEQQRQQGKSEEWVHAYANMRANGEDDTYAATCAAHYEQQRQQDKSQEWAYFYAFTRALGKDHTYATNFVEYKMQQMKAGKSHDWAHAYANMRVEGHNDAYATTYAAHFEAQLQAGKSNIQASAYASMRAQGKSHQEAEAYADTKHPNG